MQSGFNMRRTIPYALFTAAALIVYFLLMKLFGLEKNFYLRIFNFFIMGIGIYLLFHNSFSKKNIEPGAGYFQGLWSGTLLSVIAVGIFVVFLGLYMKFLDPGFLNALHEKSLWLSTPVPILQTVFIILVEGLTSGFIISFTLMQYYKSIIQDYNTR